MRLSLCPVEQQLPSTIGITLSLPQYTGFVMLGKSVLCCRAGDFLVLQGACLDIMT